MKSSERSGSLCAERLQDPFRGGAAHWQTDVAQWVFKSWRSLTFSDSTMHSRPLGSNLRGLCRVIIYNSAARWELLTGHIGSDGTRWSTVWGSPTYCQNWDQWRTGQIGTTFENKISAINNYNKTIGINWVCLGQGETYSQPHSMSSTGILFLHKLHLWWITF